MVRPRRLCCDSRQASATEGISDIFYDCSILASRDRPPSHCLYYDGPRSPIDVMIITAADVERETAAPSRASPQRTRWLRTRLTTVADGLWEICQYHSNVDPRTRACHQLSQTTLATSWMAARKFRAVFS